MILRSFGATIGDRVQIHPSAKIMLPWLLSVEDDVVVSWNVNIYNLGVITIGAHSVISQFAHLCGGTHDYTTDRFALLRSGLTIGRNVWIAADAFIGPGVSIGNNCVVAARAVVVHDVPDNTLVAGSPARPIRNISKPTRTP
jgi:putative colanic acid biosynthesis acetyltransferase WcaF